MAEVRNVFCNDLVNNLKERERETHESSSKDM